MKKFVQTGLAAIVLSLAMTAKASAEICVLFLCLPTPGGNNPPPTAPAAPEIDVTQGFAALAIVAVVGLLLRERSLRARKA